MKTRSWATSVIIGIQLLGLLGARSASAAIDVQFSAGLEIQSTSDFYQPLADYGGWVDVPRYGRCWHPAQVSADWRPYSVGHWEWTDCGWYWVSDEPWSWACYHYGGWEYDSSYGWVWIPATEWAPAWVTWREGSDYIGWAPCGPGGVALAPSFFAFVDIRHFGDPIRSRSLIFNNPTILSRTRVIGGGFQRENREVGGRRERVVVNRGPAVNTIQKSTGRSFTAKPIVQMVRQEPAPQTIKRRSDAGFNRPVLREQSRTQTQNRNQRTTAPNERTLAPNASSQTGRGRNLEPTGREQQRNQPSERTIPSERPSNVTPERTPERSAQPTPPREAIPGATPRPSAPPPATQPQKRITPEPTGRDQSRIYRQGTETRPQTEAPIQNRVTPPQREETRPQAREVRPQREETRPSLPASVREKPLEPTGRDSAPRKYEAPPQRVEPKPNPAEQPKHEESPQRENPGRDRDKEKP